MTVSKFKVTIEYHATESTVDFYWASDADMASKIALAYWRENHTERCVNPVVVKIERK